MTSPSPPSASPQLRTEPPAGPPPRADHPHLHGRPRRPWTRTARSIARPLFGAAALVALALLLFSPARYQFPLDTYATVIPAQKWILMKGANGQLISRTFNYQDGISDGYRVANFTTGSSISFTVAPSLALGRHVAAGDTVGWVSSSEMQERLVVLNGQLAAAQHLLAVNATGQKTEIVAEAEQKLQYAKRRRADYQTTIDRTQTLFDRHLISAGEYDNVQSQIHLLDDDVALAEANLRSARAGAKPEQLALVQGNIEAIKNEISAINSRVATYTLRAPIDGIVIPTAAGDTLMTIASTSGCVAQVPIHWTDYPRVAGLREPTITIPGYSQIVRGRIVSLNRELQVLLGQRVIMATAVLDVQPADLLPGSVVRCSIESAPMTVLEYAKHLFLSASAGGSF